MAAMKFNCMTHALRVERELQGRLKDLDILKNPVDAIIERGRECGRNVRQIQSLETPISDDEWRIVFWGWVVTKTDYDGHPEAWDYHFVLQNTGGTYTHRKSWDCPVSKVDIEQMIEMYEDAGYKPMYLAVRKLEE